MADLTELESSSTTKITGSDISGSETNFVNATANGDLTVADGLNSGGIFGNVTLTTANTAYEAKVGASRLVNRKSLMLIALDGDLFWGYSNTVTVSNGFPLYKGQTLTFNINANDSNFQVWVVSGNNSKNIRVVETP